MKIEIHGLDNLMPGGYVETIVDEQNVQKIGVHEEIFLTDQKYRLTTEAHSIAKEQPIQAIVLDKYRLEFLVASTHTIELMKYGDEVIIYDDGNFSKYKAIVTDVNKEQVSGRMWAITVEFYDINEANYPAGQINPVDYLESDYVLNKYGFDATTLFQVWSVTDISKFYTIHSILVPDLMTDQPSSSEVTTARGVNINPSVINKQYIEALFFLHEDDKQDVLSLLPLAGGRKIKAQMRDAGGQIYNLLETPVFESTKLNAGNLWQLRVKYMYNVVKHYEYA
jgi:hypothetical protein